MKKVPDLVFVIDTNYESLAIKESIKLSIPIVAILDTNSNPEGISFPIPGNDDARRSIDLYCNLIRETITGAKKEIPISEEKTIANPEKVNKNIKVGNEKKVEDKKQNKPLN
jgi:small subunit ribosomal protein S2